MLNAKPDEQVQGLEYYISLSNEIK